MTEREQLDQYFTQHTEEMLEDIRTLVRIPSVKGAAKPGKPFGEGPAEALKAALKMAERKGFLTHNFENYVGTANFNSKETVLGILAHLDVMPEGADWHYPAFDVTEEGGKIFGRGTADDKGPAVAALYAMCAVKEIRPELARNVRLIFGTDEESGSGDIRYYFPIEPAPPYVFSPDSDFPLINVEKGRFSPAFSTVWEPSKALPRVTEVHGADRHNVVPRTASAVVKGVTQEQLEPILAQTAQETGTAFQIVSQGGEVTITMVGESAHGARPENGNNALTALLAALCCLPLAETPSATAIHALHTMFPHGDTTGQAMGMECCDEVSGALSLNFSVLELNEGGFTAKFDCRTPVEADQGILLKKLEERLELFGAAVTENGLVPPHHVPEDSPFVQTLLRIYHDYTGNEPYCMSIGGGTYVHEIDGGVAFGCAMPGVDNRMHDADEFSIVEDLILSAKIFAQVILELCG